MSVTFDIVKLCESIAREAHGGQLRRDGTQYITHPEAVAASLNPWQQKCIAWLHDVLEDTPIVPNDLIKWGVPREIVTSVVVLTKRIGATDFTYTTNIAADPDAMAVKVADMVHNLSCDPKPTAVARYHEALMLFINEDLPERAGVHWGHVATVWENAQLRKQLDEIRRGL